MKRTLISILCIASLIFLLSGCGSQAGTSGQDSTEVRPKESVTAEAATQAAAAGDTKAEDTKAEDMKAGDTKADNSSLISEEEAKAIALKDAGLKESDVTGIRIKLEKDDGVQEYEVDFYAGNKEYDYDINASTGKIISKDTDINDDFQNNSSSGTSNQPSVTEAEATKIALAKVPEATEKDLRIHLDYEDGKQVYEGSIAYGGMEYDFEIDANSGTILEWEQEKAD